MFVESHRRRGNDLREVEMPIENELRRDFKAGRIHLMLAPWVKGLTFCLQVLATWPTGLLPRDLDPLDGANDLRSASRGRLYDERSDSAGTLNRCRGYISETT